MRVVMGRLMRMLGSQPGLDQCSCPIMPMIARCGSRLRLRRDLNDDSVRTGLLRIGLRYRSEATGGQAHIQNARYHQKDKATQNGNQNCLPALGPVFAPAPRQFLFEHGCRQVSRQISSFLRADEGLFQVPLGREGWFWRSPATSIRLNACRTLQSRGF